MYHLELPGGIKGIVTFKYLNSCRLGWSTEARPSRGQYGGRLCTRVPVFWCVGTTRTCFRHPGYTAGGGG